MSEERLHKVIAAAGLSSRRGAEVLIQDGRVTVNGKVVREMGVKVTPADEITVDGMKIRQSVDRVAVLLNKPLGVLTTMSDPRGRPTILQYLPAMQVVLKPVGRLDRDSEGLLICTNDGELAARLTHPRYGIEKVYEVRVLGAISPKSLRRLESGVFLDDKKTAPATFTAVGQDDVSTLLRVTIHEGRNRQIRRMTELVGHPVKTLKRIRYGPLTVGKLKSGQARALSQPEYEALRKAVGLE